MNKAILKSVSPKRCEQLASGECTVLLSKTAPKLETPFKCYIYETQARYKTFFIWHNRDGMIPVPNGGKVKQISVAEHRVDYTAIGRGKVIGEFVCDKIYVIQRSCSGFIINNDEALTNRIAKESCLYFDDLQKYFKGRKSGYAWHISQLKIYDKPKELGEFKRWNKSFKNDRLTCPPQSWCYVEKLQEE